MGYSSGCHANNIYLPDSGKRTEVQLYMSTACQPDSRVIRAFSGVEMQFIFSVMAVKAAQSENEKRLFNVEKARISSRVNKFYYPGNSQFDVNIRPILILLEQ